jgi:ElaB/YqjD/DUF883 family membrane-anchored ribosome-binding protein
MNNDTTSSNRTDAGRHADTRSSADIKKEIDRTLYDMDQTATQLQGRVSLHGLVDEFKGMFASSGRSAPGRLTDAVRGNPIPTALLGLGIAWMVADRLSGKGRHERYEVGRGRDADWLSPGAEYRPGRSEDVDTGGGGESGAHLGRRVGERVSGMGSSLKEGASNIAENVRGRASEAVNSVRDRVSGVSHAIGDKASHLGDRVSQAGAAAKEKLHHASDTVQRQAVVARDKTVDMYGEQPLAFGAAALALGVVGGLMVPSTRKEDEFLGPVADKVKDRAKGWGQSAMHTGQQVAQELGSKIRQDVSGDQPIAQKIRDVAHRVVDTTKQHVRESAQSMSKGQTGPGNQIGERTGDRGSDFGDQGGAPSMDRGRGGMPPIGDENVD